MKLLNIIPLCIAAITAPALNWTNYPTATVPSPTDTFLFGTATTNKLITAQNLLNWTGTNSQAQVNAASNALAAADAAGNNSTSNALMTFTITVSATTSNGAIAYANSLCTVVSNALISFSASGNAATSNALVTSIGGKQGTNAALDRIANMPTNAAWPAFVVMDGGTNKLLPVLGIVLTNGSLVSVTNFNLIGGTLNGGGGIATNWASIQGTNVVVQGLTISRVGSTLQLPSTCRIGGTLYLDASTLTYIATDQTNVTIRASPGLGMITLQANTVTPTNGITYPNLPAGNFPWVTNGASHDWTSNGYSFRRTSKVGATNWQDNLIASPPP